MGSRSGSIPNWAVTTVITERVIELLRGGYSVPQVARLANTSEVFVATLLRHLERIGHTVSAASLCASGLGACHAPSGTLSDQAQLACAGCPLVVKGATRPHDGRNLR